MADITDIMDPSGGGSSAAPVINIDFKEINSYLEGISNAIKPNNKAIIRNCALTLFTNTNFDSSSKSPMQIAKECVARAIIIANELESKNLLSD